MGSHAVQLLSPEGMPQIGYGQGVMAIENDGRYQVIERIGQGGMATAPCLRSSS